MSSQKLELDIQPIKLIISPNISKVLHIPFLPATHYLYRFLKMQELKQNRSWEHTVCFDLKILLAKSILNIEQGMMKPSNSLELSVPAD